MKALTVRQPWASLLALGIKDVENRSSGTAHRGPVAIHASRGIDANALLLPDVRRALALAVDGDPTPEHFERAAALHAAFDASRGHVIAVVDLTDVHVAAGGCCPSWGQRETGGATPRAARHWVIANPRPLPEPVAARGALGLWDLDDTLLPTGVTR